MAKMPTPVKPARVRSVAVQNRLRHPLGSPSLTVPMRDPDMIVHVVDSQLRHGRVHEMAEKGWEPVGPSDLKGKPEDFGFTVADGRVVRGERSRDVLMKMHQDDYAAIQAAKAEYNVRGMTGQKGKESVLNAVATTVGAQGDEAASFIQKSLRVTDTREPEPDLEAALKAGA